jgi:hypothetical protein
MTASSAVLYSGGLCSHLAAQRRIASHGTDDTILLFSDTGIEDEDLYRFVRDGVRHLGCTLVTVRAAGTFDEMIVRNRALPNNRMPFCSRERKVEPARKWLKEHPAITTLVFGLDWTETHRLPRVQARWPSYECVAPMMEAPYLSKPQMSEAVSDSGLTPPRLYGFGFAHNNCGGGCVRNGLAAWRLLLHAMPERYETWCRREALIPGATFVRRSTGRREPISLRELAALSCTDYDLFDIGGCGCYVDDEEDTSGEGR